MWTFKGCAGRLNAAKYLVEGITISAISKAPQSPALPLWVCAGEGRGCAGRSCPCAGIRAVRNQRDRPVGTEGEKSVRTSDIHWQNLEGEVAFSTATQYFSKQEWCIINRKKDSIKKHRENNISLGLSLIITYKPNIHILILE